ncbi:MAG: HDOD domain-containing protein [Methylococcaceae bacterium]|nr:HDOD domain-containing protein [Methylococcaceae bacterium]
MDDVNNIIKAAVLILKEESEPLQLVPSVAIKLLKLTNDEDARIDDLTRIIETEPTLAAKILRNVNSAAYFLPNKITAINRAVNILGFSTVRRIALAQLFYNKMIKPNSKQKFDQLFFWQHCLFVASLSRGIAVALKHPDPDFVYTAGLIHDIGKIVLETYGRLSYSDYISSEKSNISSHDSERSFFGLSHAEIGHVFCLEWQLPLSITAVVASHHQLPEAASPFTEFRQEIAIVAFANSVAWMQGVGSYYDADYHPFLEQDVLALINVDQLNLGHLLQQVDHEMQNTLDFYGIEFPSIHHLRATLIKAAINLSKPKVDKSDSQDKPFFLSSLTAPHHSLNTDEFLPRTLAAIHGDFGFDRVMMLTINARRRRLIAPYCWPPSEADNFDIDVNSLSGLFLCCLREKKPVLISSDLESDNPILKQLKVSAFVAIPIVHEQRLLGIIYADNFVSKKRLCKSALSELTLSASQLGIAMVNAKHYEIEKKQAQLDPLTQLYNKRMINYFMEEFFKNNSSNLDKVAIGFIDIDKFKKVNDLCGHQTGDDALKVVADIMSQFTRPEDFIGRYGGEEFIFLLKNTDKTGAIAYAERIRKEIESRGRLLREKFLNLELTASIGVATYNRSYANYTDMIKVADQAMYLAKHEGRNRVILLSGSPALV